MGAKPEVATTTSTEESKATETKTEDSKTVTKSEEIGEEKWELNGSKDKSKDERRGGRNDRNGRDDRNNDRNGRGVQRGRGRGRGGFHQNKKYVLRAPYLITVTDSPVQGPER